MFESGFEQPPGPPCPKARIIIALTFQGDSGYLNSYIERIWSDFWRKISSLASSKIRYPREAFDDEWLLSNKLDTVSIDDLTEDTILSLIPGSFIGKDWRGFEYTLNPFKAWHFVTHNAPETIPNEDQMKVLGLSWYYIVESYGQKSHWHGLANFVFPRPSNTVRQIFGLDEEANLAPVWGNWAQACRYLSDQASLEVERGVRPSGRLWVDGNNLKPKNHRFAAEDGESPVYTGLYNESYRKYLSKHLSDFKTIIEVYKDADEAFSRAVEISKLYTKRWFSVDCKQLLAPFTSKAPPNYKGEEVVLLINVVENLVSNFSNLDENSWLRYAPIVIIAKV